MSDSIIDTTGYNNYMEELTPLQKRWLSSSLGLAGKTERQRVSTEENPNSGRESGKTDSVSRAGFNHPHTSSRELPEDESVHNTDGIASDEYKQHSFKYGKPVIKSSQNGQLPPLFEESRPTSHENTVRSHHRIANPRSEVSSPISLPSEHSLHSSPSCVAMNKSLSSPQMYSPNKKRKSFETEEKSAMSLSLQLMRPNSRHLRRLQDEKKASPRINKKDSSVVSMMVSDGIEFFDGLFPSKPARSLGLSNKNMASNVLVKDETKDQVISNWKDTWTPEWRRKMAQNHADVEVYDSTRQSEIEVIHQFDEILKLVFSNKLQLASSSDQREFEKHIIQMKRFIDESLRQGRLKNGLLKGKLKRREELIEEQRKKYIQELTLLREELFRMRSDSAYIPTDYSMENWSMNPLSSLMMEEEEEEAILRDSISKTPSKRQESNPHDQLLEELKRQTESVNQTLERLKDMERKRYEDRSELQKQLEEAEMMRKALQEKENEIKQLQLQLEKAKGKGNRRLNSASSNASGSINSDADDTWSSSQSIFKKTEKMLERADSSLTKKLTDASQQISSTIQSTAKNPYQKVEYVQEMSVDALENDISHFQDSFKDIYHQMNTIQERIVFYKELQETTPPVVHNTEPPVGFVAIIFTDVESSTELWELSTTEMRKAIQIHNKVVRDILSDIPGAYEVKTEGDAFMCTFRTIDAAVECALRIQLELLEAPWSPTFMNHPSISEHIDNDGTLLWRGLRVRVGVHAGEAIAEKDPITGRMDYFGPVVNKAARIEGCARGGEIAISSLVYEAITNNSDLSSRYYCRHYGSVSLKGIEGVEEVYILLPQSLKNRPFSTKANPEDDIKEFPTQYVNDLMVKQKELELERRDIQRKVRFQMKMRNLEKAMQEKDSVIRNLRVQLDETKNNYRIAESNSDEDLKIESERKNLLIQTEISSAMKKFTKIVDEYSNMKENYDNIVQLFDHRMKAEISQFKRDLYRINGLDHISSSSSDESADEEVDLEFPSVFLDREKFRKQIQPLSRQGSMENLAFLMRSAIREVAQNESGYTHLRPRRKQSLRDDSDLWNMHSNENTPRGLAGVSGEWNGSLSPNSEMIRKRALQHLNCSDITPTDLQNSFQGDHSEFNQSLDEGDTSTAAANRRPPLPHHGGLSNSRLSAPSLRRPSTVKMLRRHNYRSKSAAPIPQSNILAQDMNLPLDQNTVGSRPYTPITIPSASVSQVDSSNSGRKNTQGSASKEFRKGGVIVKNGHVVGSYSRMLASTSMKATQSKSAGFQAKGGVEEGSTPSTNSLEAVDLIRRRSARRRSNPNPRNVRTLLKIVDRVRAQSTLPQIEKTEIPHRQFAKVPEQSLKEYYGRKFGDSIHYDEEYMEQQSKVVNPSQISFGTVFDEIASMRRVLVSRLEKMDKSKRSP